MASEKFNRSDSSVTGQSLKVLAANPDAVLVTAPGGPSVLPQVTLFDQGYKGRMYQTHGAALPDFLRLGGKKVEGTGLLQKAPGLQNRRFARIPPRGGPLA